MRDAASNDAVRVFSREFLGIGTEVRVQCTIGIALKGNGGQAMTGPFMVLSFLSGGGEVNSFISRPLIPEGMYAAITPPATVLPVVRRNWRRFDRGVSGER